MQAAGYTPYLALALLGVVPLVLMASTSFVKMTVVFSILKNAFGIGDVPSGAVITALAAILSFYVMAPVGQQIVDAAAPAAAQIDQNDPLRGDALGRALRAGAEPLKRFLEANSNRRERGLFYDLARRRQPQDQRATIGRRDLMVLLPAFLITELIEAFQMGFIIFLPFLVVDLVVANVLLSLGLSSLDPNRVSLPFKLLLFVLAGGWYLLSRALVMSYA